MTRRDIESDGWITLHPASGTPAAPASRAPDPDATLAQARGVLADCPHHGDAAVIAPAATVTRLSPDPRERARAYRLAELIEATR